MESQSLYEFKFIIGYCVYICCDFFELIMAVVPVSFHPTSFLLRPDLVYVVQNEKMGSFGDFVVEWDSPNSQDVILRKKCSSSGEEVAISALLGRDTFHEDSRFPAEALLKICVKKPGLSSILKFDCVASNRGGTQPDFHIHNAHYIQSSSLSSSVYRGPLFRYLPIEIEL